MFTTVLRIPWDKTEAARSLLCWKDQTSSAELKLSAFSGVRKPGGQAGPRYDGCGWAALRSLLSSAVGLA